MKPLGTEKTNMRAKTNRRGFSLVKLVELLVAIVAIVLIGPGVTAAPKLPIPDAAARKAASKDIKDLYEDQFKQAKSVKAKTALANELFKQGVGTRDDPASRYELLRITKNIATGAGDTDLALQAIDQLDKYYKIDALQLKTDALQSITKTFESKERSKAVAEKASSLINQAVAADRFDLAKQLAEIALAAARKVRDRDLTKQAAERLEEIEPLEAEYAKVKLALKKLDSDPTDSTANLTVGKFRCFMQDNWSVGLPMIALGSDAKLQKLATTEMKNPTTHTAQASLANGWWDLSETLEGSAKLKLQYHAAMWYRKALPKLSGIAKVKATRRLAELAPPPETTSTKKQPAKLVKPVYLSDMQEFNVRVLRYEGVWLFSKRGIFHGSRIMVNGRHSAKGIVLHPMKNSFSSVSYKLNKKASLFKGAAAIMDHPTKGNPFSPLTFEVVGDGKLLWRSAALRKNGQFQPFRVSVTGVDTLTLRVRCPGPDGNARAVWADPFVVPIPSQSASTTPKAPSKTGPSKTGPSVGGPSPTPVKKTPSLAEQIAGTWVVRFSQTATYPAMERTYMFDAQGNAMLVEKKSRGRVKKLNKRSRLINRGGYLILPWSDGKLDRLSFQGGRLTVQLFESRADFPNRPAVSGTGTKR